jgi:rhamnose transport system ATP-binding protein
MSAADASVEATAGGPGALPPALLFEDVRKTYPGTQALKGVSLSVQRGEFRALVGENGSGKSTLVGILGGRVAADDGARVEVYGETLPQNDPAASRDLGVAIIHQELLMVPQLSAVENVFLGDMPRRKAIVAYDRMRKEFLELTDRLGISIDPRVPAGALSVAQQTMLEIMRAVRRRARVLVMDEPTVTLGVLEREKLYEILEGLRDQQVTVLLISHDLDEVLRLADSVTVFRDGNLVETAAKAHWSKAKLVEAMLGEKRGAETMSRRAAARGAARATDNGAVPPASARSQPILSISNLRAGKVHLAGLTVRSGEILGLAGLVGSGRTSLLRAVAGAAPVTAGDLSIDGERVRWPRSVHEALSRGIALLPEDRKNQGLVLGLPADDNVIISNFRAIASLGVLRRSKSRERAGALLKSVEFRGRIDGPVRTLSGGNQQKVMVAKWLHRGPRILLIDEPTRGIDIGAKQDIMRVLEELAARGHAIVWVSSELEEVEAVSHRVLVMTHGRVVDELVGADIDVARMMRVIFDSTEDLQVDAEATPQHGAMAP